MESNPMKTFFDNLLDNEKEKKILELIFEDLEEEKILENLLNINSEEDDIND